MLYFIILEATLLRLRRPSLCMELTKESIKRIFFPVLAYYFLSRKIGALTCSIIREKPNIFLLPLLFSLTFFSRVSSDWKLGKQIYCSVKQSANVKQSSLLNREEIKDASFPFLEKPRKFHFAGVIEGETKTVVSI